MKKIIFSLIILFSIISYSIACIRLIERQYISNNTIERVCINGYEYVIVSNNTRVSIIQSFKLESLKSYPPTPIRCNCENNK